jgi:hypothetical protein
MCDGHRHVHCKAEWYYNELLDSIYDTAFTCDIYYLCFYMLQRGIEQMFSLK